MRVARPFLAGQFDNDSVCKAMMEEFGNWEGGSVLCKYEGMGFLRGSSRDCQGPKSGSANSRRRKAEKSCSYGVRRGEGRGGGCSSRGQNGEKLEYVCMHASVVYVCRKISESWCVAGGTYSAHTPYILIRGRTIIIMARWTANWQTGEAPSTGP